MRLEAELPHEYGPALWSMPALNEDGVLTARATRGLENTLYLYSKIAKGHARKSDNNPANFTVKRILIGGSVARENKIDSDLDFILICPAVDERSADHVKQVMSYVLYCDRSKIEAIDVYVRPEDKYPERPSIDITDQASGLISRYNSELIK